MEVLDKNVVLECKKKLLEAKMDFLNQFVTNREKLNDREERSGDEADQTQRILVEKEAITNQSRIRRTLTEIERALARIDSGRFGICEETEEPIERDRLLAIPWTRLSIEGAEIRESEEHKKII